MLTYQDLQEINIENESEKMDFVRSVINSHKSGDLYKTAVIADEYDHKRNATIMRYEKTLRTLAGSEIPDSWSPNHKTTRNFFNYFTTQQNQYLLGNGVSWQDEATAEKLGEDFDTQLQKAGKKALVQAISFGFFNLDHLEVFELKEFAPLYDEENGSLRAGVRFWQISDNKPLRATLYEEDGYTSYIWNERDQDGKLIEGGRVYEEKKPYILKFKSSEIDGTVIYDGENYPTFPIVPLWGNPLHQSELVGIQEQIDAYDLIKNGFLNDLDTAQLYWIIQGAGGMDDVDLAQFMDKLRRTHFASTEGDQTVSPVTVDIPYDAREILLTRLERDLYKDYSALNVDEIKGGAVTATQILAAYEPLNVKADQYEYCVIDFLQGILKVAGIEGETPTFTRSKLVNVSEEVQTVLQAAETLDEEYTTQKVLNLLGDGDKFEEIQGRKASDELERSGISGETVVDEAERYKGRSLNGIQTESLLSVIGQYSQGALSENQAINIISASIGIDRNEARSIVLGTDDMASVNAPGMDNNGFEAAKPIEEPAPETGEKVDIEALNDASDIEELIRKLTEKLKRLKG